MLDDFATTGGVHVTAKVLEVFAATGVLDDLAPKDEVLDLATKVEELDFAAGVEVLDLTTGVEVLDLTTGVDVLALTISVDMLDLAAGVVVDATVAEEDAMNVREGPAGDCFASSVVLAMICIDRGDADVVAAVDTLNAAFGDDAELAAADLSFADVAAAPVCDVEPAALDAGDGVD